MKQLQVKTDECTAWRDADERYDNTRYRVEAREILSRELVREVKLTNGATYRLIDKPDVLQFFAEGGTGGAWVSITSLDPCYSSLAFQTLTGTLAIEQVKVKGRLYRLQPS